MSSADRTTRRDFLRTAAAGAAGLALTSHLRAADLPGPAGTAKACVFINLVGGPSHIDTFDPKPDTPSEVRGPFRPIPTRVPGVHLSELFPKLAAMADKFALIRSMHHDAPPIHECGFQLLNTGRLFRDGPEWPAVGSVLSYLRNPSAHWAESYAVTPFYEVDTGVSVPHGVLGGWLEQHPEFHEYEPRRRPDEFCTGVVHHIEWGQQFVLVRQFSTVFDAPSWDCHADRGSLACDLTDYHDTVAPAFDTAFAQLLTDLDQRGLLDTTLVVATGEFGRTPFVNANGGRDHWANCWTALVAGGGVKGGRVIGASDRLGGEPTDRPVTPQELVATVFHALGVAPDATIPGPTGEPVAVYPGRPVVELF
jgi:hypothetical protein